MFCYKQLENNEKTLEYLLKYNGIEPNVFEIIVLIGDCYFILGYLENAQKYFEKALNIAGENKMMVLMFLAHVQLCYQNEIEAIRLYQENLSLFEDKKKFFTSMEADYQYLAPHGVRREQYDKVVARLRLI